MNKRAVGAAYEARAASLLEQNGYRILCRNYRCRAGEIDLIARHRGYLVFVEVKYRGSGRSGNAGEAVDLKKQRRIIRAAGWYLAEHSDSDGQPCRFDVVVFNGDEAEVIEDAFWT